MPHSDIERRITLRLLAYWEKLRKGRPMPAEQDIDPEDLEDLWDCCLLLHVRDLGKKDFDYKYLGQSIINAYQSSGLTLHDSNGLISTDALKLAGNYAKVISTRKPVVEEGEFRTHKNDVIKYRQCLLPLGSGEKVEAIFGGMRFKIFPAQ